MVREWLSVGAAVLVDPDAELVTPVGRELAERGLNVVLAVSERASEAAVGRAVAEVCATGAQSLVVRGELSGPGRPQWLFDEAIDGFGAVSAAVLTVGSDPAALSVVPGVLLEASSRIEDGSAIICVLGADDQRERLRPLLEALHGQSAARGLALVGLVARCTATHESAPGAVAELAALVGRIVTVPQPWQGVVSDLDAGGDASPPL